jgi:hypothetical protein
MANENLKNALQNAGLTPEEFAAVIRVDPKSVGRWVAGTTVPYPRHRAAISRALDLSEHELWPNETPAPPPGRDGVVAGCDVIGTWAYADQHNAPNLVAFITNTDGPIDVFDPYPGIASTEGLVEAIAAQAAIGRPVRILSSQPLPDFAPLVGRDGIEILDCKADLGCWFIQAGDRMLLSINLQDDETLVAPPLIELTGLVEDGLFERLETMFEELWVEAEHHNAYHEQASIVPVGGNADEKPQHDNLSAGVTSPADHPRTPEAEPPSAQPIETEQRRWPGRPD